MHITWEYVSVRMWLSSPYKKKKMFHNKNIRAFCQWKPCKSYFGIFLCSHVLQLSVCWEFHCFSLLSCLRLQSLGHSNNFAFLLSEQPNSVSKGVTVTVGVQPNRGKTIVQFHECIDINLEALIFGEMRLRSNRSSAMAASGAIWLICKPPSLCCFKIICGSFVICKWAYIFVLFFKTSV